MTFSAFHSRKTYASKKRWNPIQKINKKNIINDCIHNKNQRRRYFNLIMRWMTCRDLFDNWWNFCVWDSCFLSVNWILVLNWTIEKEKKNKNFSDNFIWLKLSADFSIIHWLFIITTIIKNRIPATTAISRF